MFLIEVNRQLRWWEVVGVRKSILLIGCLALLAWRRPNLGHLRPVQWMQLAALTVVGGPLYHLVFSWSAGVGSSGASRLDPALLGLIMATVPVHTSWLAWIVLRESLTFRKILALALGLTGVFVVVLGRHGSVDLWPREALEGPIGATASAIIAGGIVVLTRACGRFLGPIDLVAVSGVGIGVLCAPLLLITSPERLAAMSPLGWGAIIWLGTGASLLAFVTWATALRRLQALTVATYLFLSSLLAACWQWLLGGDGVQPTYFLGAGLILTGLLIMAHQGARAAATTRRAARATASPDGGPARLRPATRSPGPE